MIMGHIILSIVFLVVTVWSLKGTTFAEYCFSDRVGEYHAAVWMAVIAFIFYCIPIINIIVFIGYCIWFFILASRNPQHRHGCYLIIELSKENVLHRILGITARYLTKEL